MYRRVDVLINIETRSKLEMYSFLHCAFAQKCYFDYIFITSPIFK